MKIYLDLIAFLKSPKLGKDANKDFIYRSTSFVQLLFLCLFISVAISIVISRIYELGWIANEYHAFDGLLEFSVFKILFIASVMAPLLEELIFRAPLTAFKSPWKLYRTNPETRSRVFINTRIPLFENPRSFSIAFYGMAILFGYVHLFNYQIDGQILFFSPILVAPQMILGLIFGFIRIRFGLAWSVAMHAFYNGILVSLFLLAENGFQ